MKLHYDIFQEQAVIHTGVIIGIPPEPADSVWQTVEWFKGEGNCIIPNWNSLSLPSPVNGPQGAHYQSKFARNAQKYGFTWPKEENPLYWEHPYMNKYQSVKILMKVLNKFKDNKRLSNWNYVQKLACNTDYSFIDSYFDNLRQHAPYKRKT